MQSTGHTSTHAVSLVPMHGSQMMYAMNTEAVLARQHTRTCKPGLGAAASAAARLVTKRPDYGNLVVIGRSRASFVTMILKKRPGVGVAAAALILLCAGALTVEADGPPLPRACGPALTVLFTPRLPRLGRYDVCPDSRPLAEITPPDWPVQALDPADA